MRGRLSSHSRSLGVSLAAALLLAAARPAEASPGQPPSALPPAPAPAFAPDAVKAAFLINFIRFTDWPTPPSRDSPYVVGISGNRALEDELFRLADRQLVRGHRLRVVRIRSARDLETLHLAFFDTGAPHSLEAFGPREALPLLARRPVLTVSDSPGFLPLGGMIQLFREESALRFAIAPEAARAAGLVISSRLLALASIYREEPPAP